MTGGKHIATAPSSMLNANLLIGRVSVVSLVGTIANSASVAEVSQHLLPSVSLMSFFFYLFNGADKIVIGSFMFLCIIFKNIFRLLLQKH